jgi:eukaryotic-like serine/threonine-protein kinase
MSLAPATHLAHYRIVAKLGAGGMGEVWRAVDTRLDREVAIKVLPAAFARDAERLRRFEQEARATSALNHPNILTVYDIGTAPDENGGAPFIVAELLAGVELRALLDGGALPVPRAVDYARQVAAGLSAAHEKGVVHRDLKPENLFVTTDDRVKILDFGLAKLRAPRAGGVASDAPTQRQITGPGVIMGTVGYMSPEQVRGQEADHRSDIFSFGLVLYEMLSGRRAFNGASVADVMSAILKEEPPELGEANAKVGPQLEKIVRRCLEKKPERRFQSASDLGFALEALATPSSSSGSSNAVLTTPAGAPVRGASRERGWMIATGVLALIALAALSVSYFNRPSTDARAVRLTFTPPENLAYENGLFDRVVVSPDGQKLAFTGRSADGRRQLYVRPLDSAEAQLLPGTDDPIDPFWSPDSRSLGFGSQGKLKRVDLAGGRPQTLCSAIRFNGGSWNRDGVVIFAPNEVSGVFQIPATGGEPKQVTSRSSAQASAHRNPYFLPDGRHFLYQEGTSVFVGSLNSKDVKQLLSDGAPAIYAPPGWLLFVSNGALRAQRFDATRLELKGEAVALTKSADLSVIRGLPLSVSENGVLIWEGDKRRDAQLGWVDRAGRQGDAIDAQVKGGVGETLRLSPDGKRLAVTRADPQLLNQDIWVIDLARDLPTRLTFDPAREVNPIWSPDGSRVAYFSIQRGGIYQRAANGAGPEELLLEVKSIATSDWSPDGRFILYSQLNEQTDRDVWALPLAESRQVYPLLNSEFDEYRAQLSPDGRWLAYVSNESGGFEIYVQPFTADGKLGGDKVRISTGGGNQPRWRRDGQELFYVAGDRQMMAVGVQTSGATFERSAPKALFQTRILTDMPMQLGFLYDVTADGQRFLIRSQVGEATPVSVILNWTAEVEK